MLKEKQAVQQRFESAMQMQAALEKSFEAKVSSRSTVPQRCCRMALQQDSEKEERLAWVKGIIVTGVGATL